MAKAHKAPRRTYVRKFEVSRLAGQRLREIVLGDFQSRSDGDLCSLIDEKLRDAKDPLYVTDVDRPDVIQEVYALTFTMRTKDATAERIAHAVARGGTVVTMMPEDLVARNLRTGQWVRATQIDIALDDTAPPAVEVRAPAAAATLIAMPPPPPARPELLVDISLEMTQLAVDHAEAEIALLRARAALTAAEERAVQARARFEAGILTDAT